MALVLAMVARSVYSNRASLGVRYGVVYQVTTLGRGKKKGASLPYRVSLFHPELITVVMLPVVTRRAQILLLIEC